MAGGGGVRGGTGWSSLPADLLLAVFALLPSDADRVRFRAVCAAWATAAAAWCPRPWLVGSRTDRSGRGGGTVSSFWLSRPAGAGAALLRPFAAAVPAGLDYLSSSRGYLALSDPSVSPKAVVLVNPVTGRRVRLPPIGFFKRWLDVTTVVLSADPGGAAEWAAVAVGFPTTSLAYYSSAAGAWARLDFAAPGYAGVEHYSGRFYVAFGSRICALEADGDAPAVIPLERVDDDGADGSDDEPKLPGGSGRRVVETHLVECDGQLLLVSVHDDVVYSSDDDMGGLAVDEGGSKGGGDARAVEVHRVEWLWDGRVRLVRETDLGRNALFLGRNRAFALSAAEFPACRVNCVYLVDRQGHPDGVVRVLDLENPWACREETICPDDATGGSASSAGWARRGWFFPNY